MILSGTYFFPGSFDPVDQRAISIAKGARADLAKCREGVHENIPLALSQVLLVLGGDVIVDNRL